ncbi:MAG: BTAD domain-containing putative transcriptional regulator, partial [Ilumatobacteraceae bacterium]
MHRLSDLGAVCTAAAYGTSQEGFDAEWRMILILAVEGDLFSRGEVFEETDLDAALQEFDELNRPVRKLENAASQVLERVWALLADRDWVAITKSMADDFNSHDHRRVVNAGVRRGRDVHIENMRAVAEVGFENLTSSAIATRGERLALSRVRSSVHGLPPGEVSNESLSIVEIDAENRLAAHAVFDVEDIDAAFAELDSWYLTGEAAAHSQAWSVIAGMYAGFNRGQRPATTPDWVKIDHRSLIKIEPGDLSDFIGAVWDLTPELKIHMETVHRLNDLGAVVTHTAHGLTREGFDAEWRMIAIVTVDGDRISRWEIFDEAELDAALQKLDELNRPVRKLENAASQEFDRFSHYFSVRDWASIAEMLVDDYSADDRRPVVNAGFRRGRDAAISETRAIADSGTTNITSTVIATRGQRLALCRTRVSG